MIGPERPVHSDGNLQAVASQALEDQGQHGLGVLEPQGVSGTKGVVARIRIPAPEPRKEVHVDDVELAVAVLQELHSRPIRGFRTLRKPCA